MLVRMRNTNDVIFSCNKSPSNTMEVNTMFDELRGDERSKDLLRTVTKNGLLSFEY